MNISIKHRFVFHLIIPHFVTLLSILFHWLILNMYQGAEALTALCQGGSADELCKHTPDFHTAVLDGLKGRVWVS